MGRQVNHQLWWIDVIVVVIFVVFVAQGWYDSKKKYPDQGNDEFRQRVADGMRAAASAGLTVVAILLPTTVIGVQLSVATSDRLLVGHAAAANLFIASCWLLLSVRRDKPARRRRWKSSTPKG
jgi:undecaprenyl pyrophosphate phosphatase UppP